MKHQLTVSEPARLDVFLAKELPLFSRAKIQSLITAGHATVNTAIVHESKHAVKLGDKITFLEPKLDPDFPLAESVGLTIVHEDDAIMVIDKPVGMVTHPTTFQETGTLVQAVLALYPEIKQAVYDAENPISRMRPGIVHRLDKDTSGLIVVAKTREALLNLVDQFHKRTVQKEYQTLLYGRLAEPRTVSAPIHRKGGGSSNIMVASHDPGQGRVAVTHFTPVKTWAPYEKWPEELVTQVCVKIETGRTHQIRVHAKFIGLPVMGDQLYGNKPSQKLSEKLGLVTQQLRAVNLSFLHPTTGKLVSFSVE